MNPRAKKNFTLSLPVSLIRSAKVLAAKRGTSVHALIKQALVQMVRAEDRYDAALRRILAASRSGLYRTKKKLTRSELYG